MRNKTGAVIAEALSFALNAESISVTADEETLLLLTEEATSVS